MSLEQSPITQTKKVDYESKVLFFQVGKRVVLSLYWLSIVFLILLSAYIFLEYKGEITDRSSKITVLFLGIFITIIGGIGSILLSLIIELPNISNDFDHIKNDIASKLIKHPNEFSHRVTALLCDYCNYPFLDIKFSFLYVEKHNLISSDSNKKVNLGISKDYFNSVQLLAKYSEEVFSHDDVFYLNQNYKATIIPIWFAGRYLGFLGVLTKYKINWFIKSFLSNFEDLYIDDQLVHVLNNNKQIMQKNFYREIDFLSNKITKNKYTTIEDYQNDLLGFLIKKVRCKAGIFATIYNAGCVSIFNKKSSLEKVTIEYFDGHPVDLSANIYSDSNVSFEFIFSIPILIDKLQGVIYLFDDSKECFEYFNLTLREIEDIKLDNDLESLANQLKLEQVSNSYISG